jgi:hypothetical protein
VPSGKRHSCVPAALAALAAGFAVTATPALAHEEKVVETARTFGHTVTVSTHVDSRQELGEAAGSGQASRQLGLPADMPSLGGPAGSLPAPWLADDSCPTEYTVNDTADAVNSTAPVIKVIYAYPSDQPDRFQQYRSVIQEQVKTISGLVYATSGQRRSLRFDLGTPCGASYVDVQSIALPHTLAFYQGYTVNGTPSRFDEIVNDVNGTVGSSVQRRNFLIYADYLGGGGFPASGQAELVSGPLGQSDRPDASNPHNAGGFFAVAYGASRTFFTSNSQAFGDEVALHEITHNLGAVQDSAPHSSQAGHCYDESDVECYNDGGPYFSPGGGSLVQSCSDNAHEVYDCNLDDFFNPSPAPGSYLGTHWDLFNSVFLCDAGACGTGGGGVPPTTPIPPPPTAVVTPPPTAQNPPTAAAVAVAVAFSSSTLARAVGLLRAAARVAVRVKERRPTLRVGRASCPKVCRGTLSVYVLRGYGVRHTVSLGRLVFALRQGQAATLRVTVSTRARGLLRRHRRLNASLTLAANRATVTRRFTLRAA